VAIAARGTGARAVPCRMKMLRISLVGLAALSGALLAHVVIDIVGDYVLARDAYDGITHGSRVVLSVGLAALVLAFGACLLFDLISRQCSSRVSLLRQVRESLGGPIPFVAQSTAVCIAALAGMELLDCFAANAMPAGVNELFGGSYLLGLTAACCAAVLSGWFVHATATFLSKREPEIIAFIRCLMARALPVFENARVDCVHQPYSIARALLLATRGRKRGPPLPTPV